MLVLMGFRVGIEVVDFFAGRKFQSDVYLSNREFDFEIFYGCVLEAGFSEHCYHSVTLMVGISN